MGFLFMLIEVILLLWLALHICHIIRAIILRKKFLFKLKKICESNHYTLTQKRSFLFGFLKKSPTPDLIINAHDTEYLIRYVTCFARKRFYYFVTPYYCVRYMKWFFAIRFGGESTMQLLETALCFPEISKEYDQKGEKQKKILLFSPSPVEIAYRSDHQGVKIAGNGTEFNDWLIFSQSGFTDFLHDCS